MSSDRYRLHLRMLHPARRLALQGMFCLVLSRLRLRSNKGLSRLLAESEDAACSRLVLLTPTAPPSDLSTPSRNPARDDLESKKSSLSLLPRISCSDSVLPMFRSFTCSACGQRFPLVDSMGVRHAFHLWFWFWTRRFPYALLFYLAVVGVSSYHLYT